MMEETSLSDPCYIGSKWPKEEWQMEWKGYQSSNPHHPAFVVATFQPVALLNSYHGCWIRVDVVESTLLLSNPRRLAFVIVTFQLVVLLNLYCGCRICIVVIKSTSSGFHCWTLGIVNKLVLLLSNPHRPDLSVFAGHLWRLACAENESERSGPTIMGNKNTPCSCDSPSQSSLITNPAQILAQKSKKCWPTSLSEGRGSCKDVRSGFEGLVLSSRHLRQVNISPHPSARGGACVG